MITLATWIVLLQLSVVAGDDYCFGDMFEPRCGDAEVIVIVEALYGRMKVGTCLHSGETGLGIGCEADVTDLLTQKCAGRFECVVDALDKDIIKLRPCGRRMHYLQVNYECIPVISTGRDFCQPGDVLQITSPTSSNIASVVTKNSGCGSQDSPWLIEAPPGQSIMLTLIDFASSDDHRQDSSTCLVYAEIKEPNSQRGTPVCGAQGRERVVYESVGHRLELKIVSQGEDNYFMLNYTFVGCTNMAALTGTILNRSGNTTEMKCEFTEEKTAAYCDGTSWVGSAPNCTIPEVVVEAETAEPAPEVAEKTKVVIDQSESVDYIQTETMSFDFSSISWGMVLILVGIMTLGMVACVLIIGVVYLKKRANEMKAPPVFPGRPMSESGYETCDFTVARRPSSVYRGGYRTLPKDYTPMMNGSQPGYNTDVWERPLPPEPLVNPADV